ncbi:MAG TPA: Gldg family protein, partial [Candidatus Acidoferrum sp.]|nr:Gldg family protein [Candidatus Acidoferrum sp.]
DLLEEFGEASRGKIKVRKIDPKPDTEAEEMAQADGIEPRPTSQLGGENYYMGLVVSLDPEKAALPFLPADRERLLEYDLARAIGRVIATNKPVIGVMTPLPMFGSPMNPMMAMRMGQQPQRPWVFIQELQRDYDVRQVQMTAETIEEAIQVLVVAHPKEITDQAQYAIDQFVMRGGKVLAFLDAMSVVDKPPQQPNNPMAGMLPGGGSSLPKLLQTWGIAFDSTKVVADLNFTRELAFQRGQRPQSMPTWLFVNPDGINKSDVTTAQLDNLLFPSPGAFSGTAATGIEQTVLVHTTKKSQFVDGMNAQFSPQKIMDDFKASGTEYALALRLKGKFKSAFPEGKPAAAPEEKKEGEAEKKDEKKPADNSLKESKTEGVVILVADTDFLYDNFAFDPQMLQFGVANPINGNFALAQNLLEQLSGDVSLVGTRSRGALRRPFTVVQRLQTQAEDQYRDKIRKLNEDLQETQKQLNELQAKKEPGQTLILSPQQQAKITEFQTKKRTAERDLRELRKNLRQDIDSLENRLKWVNIGGMPLLVIAAGIFVAIARKQRTKAK